MVILLGILAVSCRQDPIFFTIASETAPRIPRIEGAPTNMVVFEREYDDRDEPVPVMYVASGRLHWYAKGKDDDTPRWDSNEYTIDQPGGKIIYLAATSKYLYALCLSGHGVNTVLKRIGRDSTETEWATLDSPPGNYLIQSIYAHPEEPWLFAGVRTRNAARYAIFYLDETDDTFTIVKAEMTATLSGAACRDGAYYLCTKGDGIFKVNDIAEGNVEELPDTTNTNTRTFMGIVKLGDNSIVAVARNGGYLYSVGDDSFARMNYDGSTDWIATGRYATGALALWERIDPESGETTQRMLIAGIQGGLYTTYTSSYTNGYVEFDLHLDGSFNTGSSRHDSGRLQSVHDQDRYTASIGKHPINHLFQVPQKLDAEITFFASTQTAGLWSYRDLKDGGWQWNAED